MRAQHGFAAAGTRSLRTTGTRYGIEMAGLDRRYRDELDGHYLGDWTHAEIMGAFCLVDDRYGADTSVMVDERSGDVVPIAEGLAIMRCIDWTCVACHKRILSALGDISRENLLCSVCVNAPGGRIRLEDSLVQASVRFTDACKAHLRDRTKYILRTMQSNAKRRKPTKA